MPIGRANHQFMVDVNLYLQSPRPLGSVAMRMRTENKSRLMNYSEIAAAPLLMHSSRCITLRLFELWLTCSIASPVFRIHKSAQPCVRNMFSSHDSPTTRIRLPELSQYLSRMAEIIAIAASGAGLASLAIQLMESSQKLHSFYHTCKDAPDTVNQLSFELTTLSKHILQLQRLKDQQNQAGDAECEELLDRCLHDCARMSAKINTAVKKIEQSLQKSSFVGRVYTAFKEPEIRKILAEIEQAKTHMILAHLQYIE